MQATFLEFGPVLDVELKLDARGVSTGVARVKFESRDSALAAIARYNGRLADGMYFTLLLLERHRH